MNIVEPIFAQCRRKPSELALAAPGTDFHMASYGRLESSVNNVARRALSADLVAGDRVALFIDDPILHAIMLIAFTRIGLVTVSGRNRNVSWRFEIDAVITDKSFQFPSGRIILADRDWINGSGQPLSPQQIHNPRPDEICRIFLTSGTTGHEKGIAVTHRMMMERISRQHMHFGSVVSFSSRIYMDLGLTTSLGFQLLISTLWRGGALFVTGEAQATVSAMPFYRVQSMIVSPGGLANFLDAAERRPEYESRFEGIWTGGSSISTALADRARARICANLTIAYGSTEATMVASAPAQFTSLIPGAVGYVFPGINVQIVDHNNEPLPPGKEGVVRIKSRFGASGYLDDPDETGRVFRDGWFYPGDLGYLTTDNMLVISGRSVAVLNVGGEKISPERIEEILSSHPSIAQAAVVALPTEQGVDELVAIVVLRSNLNVDDVVARCAPMLPSALVPSRFVPVPEIPRNETGKIDRQRLPALAKKPLN